MNMSETVYSHDEKKKLLEKNSSYLFILTVQASFISSLENAVKLLITFKQS